MRKLSCMPDGFERVDTYNAAMQSNARVRPVSTAPLHERVYDELRTSIVRGRFAPGERVTIRELAAQFGTSAMPVRDALTRLVAERAVEMPSSRAFRIPLMSRSEFVSLCEFRVLIECHAVTLATPLVTPAELAAVEKLNNEVTRHFKAGNYEATLDANAEFLFTIYRASRESIVVSYIESLWLRSGPYLLIRLQRMAEAKDAGRLRSIGHHQELLDALRRRNSRAAAHALKHDIAETMTTYLPEGLLAG